ncbi:hypothetical protein E2C01_009147 [Portunus trituberculatus]|uniref:Uncharacterized protein n=1 Tax=Portunus trituberculatus TaxID=210409 RepID=A0A5B7D5B8_PORTR|nr:hypothetical protein [Portunus trituberculatus]
MRYGRAREDGRHAGSRLARRRQLTHMPYESSQPAINYACLHQYKANLLAAVNTLAVSYSQMEFFAIQGSGEVLPSTPRSPFTLPAFLSAPSTHWRHTHRFSTNTYIPVRGSWVRDLATG